MVIDQTQFLFDVAAVGCTAAFALGGCALWFASEARFWRRQHNARMDRIAPLESKLAASVATRAEARREVERLAAEVEWFKERDRVAAERRSKQARHAALKLGEQRRAKLNDERPARQAATVKAVASSHFRPRDEVVAGVIERRKAKQSGNAI